MRTPSWGALRLVGVAASVTLVLAGCGGGDIKNNGSGGTGGTCTDTLDMAVNPWVGYEADAYVVGEVASKQLGCEVKYHTLKEQISWAGFGTGAVDVVMENWGHVELAAKYITSDGGDGSATDFGQTGNKGIIGWYVPPWLAKAHPDITDWHNLNKYAPNFKTSESDGLGQFLDGDPTFVTNDEALIKNLHLNYKVVYAGSETALIQAFKQAETNHTWVIGYFYEPQWFLTEVPLVKVDLPKWTPGCDSDVATVACDYPVYNLNKVVSTDWSTSGQPDVSLVKNFTWTNDDQNTVAAYIAKDGMDPAAAADKWIADNQAKVDAWLGN